MRDALIADLFHHLARTHDFVVDRAPREVEERIERLPLPTDVKRLLQWTWPRQPVVLGPYELIPAEGVLEHPDLSDLLAAAMAPVGSAQNGDIVVIACPDPRRAELGLVSHDELWEGESGAADAYVTVCATIEEYLSRVAEDRYLPIDAVAAEEWRQLRSEIGHGEDGT